MEERKNCIPCPPCPPCDKTIDVQTYNVDLVPQTNQNTNVNRSKNGVPIYYQPQNSNVRQQPQNSNVRQQQNIDSETSLFENPYWSKNQQNIDSETSQQLQNSLISTEIQTKHGNVKLTFSNNNNNKPTKKVNAEDFLPYFDMVFHDMYKILGDSVIVKIPDYISVTLLYFMAIMKFTTVGNIGFSEITIRSFPFVGKQDEILDVHFLLKRHNNMINIYVKIKTANNDVLYQVSTKKDNKSGTNSDFVKLHFKKLIDDVTFGENTVKTEDNDKISLLIAQNSNIENYVLSYGCDGNTKTLDYNKSQFLYIARDILGVNVDFISDKYKVKNMNSISVKSDIMTLNINNKPVKCQLCVVDTGIEYKYCLEPLNDPNNRYDICDLSKYDNINVMPNLKFIKK